MFITFFINYVRFVTTSLHPTLICTSLLRHALERLSQVLLAEWQLALSPDLGVLHL